MEYRRREVLEVVGGLEVGMDLVFRDYFAAAYAVAEDKLLQGRLEVVVDCYSNSDGSVVAPVLLHIADVHSLWVRHDR